MNRADIDAHAAFEQQRTERMTQMVAQLIAFAAPGLRGYEAAKRGFDALCPDASPAERDEAMRKIAKACRV